jgi:hypothetical protein
MGVHRTLGRRFGLLGTSMLGAMIVAAPAFAQEAPQSATEGANDASGEIIVTATRKSEALSKVPLSVSAFSTETLDKRGVRDFSDVIRQTPGVVFEATNTTTNIAIRGINSTVGAATTGVYIDDTPIQVRALGYSGGNAYPVIFDLERIEVLRGRRARCSARVRKAARSASSRPSRAPPPPLAVSARNSPSPKAARRAVKSAPRSARRSCRTSWRSAPAGTTAAMAGTSTGCASRTSRSSRRTPTGTNPT